MIILFLGQDGCNDAPCGECEGDCDKDSQCKGNLKCFQRTSSSQTVPGCSSIHVNAVCRKQPSLYKKSFVDNFVYTFAQNC